MFHDRKLSQIEPAQDGDGTHKGYGALLCVASTAFVVYAIGVALSYILG